ncbi:MAG: SRPBCC family protein [Deltaproteobacteria bacterium]|nr:SRPBCC family protein [Deltaproteobacteria bacterium]
MKKGVIWLAAAAAMFSSVATARAQSNSSIVEQFAVTSPAILQSLLQKGQLIFIDNAKPGEPQFVTVITLFDAPIDKVFSTITDYDHYVGNIPQTTEVRVTKKQGNTWFVNYKIEFKFSIIAEHANYTLKQVLDPPKSVTWTRTAGNLDRVEGSWRLISIDNGEKTIAFYREYTDISSLGFLVRYMLEKQPVLNTAISTSSALVYAKAMEKWVDGGNKQPTAKK